MCMFNLLPLPIFNSRSSFGGRNGAEKEGNPTFCHIELKNADGSSFTAVTPIIVQDGLCKSHLYPPSSKHHLARTIISGCILYIVCLVVGTLGAEPGILPWHSQTGCLGRLDGLYQEWGGGEYVVTIRLRPRETGIASLSQPEPLRKICICNENFYAISRLFQCPLGTHPC